MTVDVQSGSGPEAGGPIGSGILLVDPAHSCDPIKVATAWREAGWRVMHMSGGADLGSVLPVLDTRCHFLAGTDTTLTHCVTA